jgi:hypothetical protein
MLGLKRQVLSSTVHLVIVASNIVCSRVASLLMSLQPKGGQANSKQPSSDPHPARHHSLHTASANSCADSMTSQKKSSRAVSPELNLQDSVTRHWGSCREPAAWCCGRAVGGTPLTARLWTATPHHDKRQVYRGFVLTSFTLVTGAVSSLLVNGRGYYRRLLRHVAGNKVTLNAFASLFIRIASTRTR